MSKVVRAIDVGYGQTKYVTGMKNNEIACGIFPSIAAQYSGHLINDDFFKSTDILKINVSGTTKVIGQNVLNYQGHLMQKIMDDSYSGSDNYMALTLGAMAYMKIREIDLLVVGLPVSIYKFKEKRENLRKKLIGKHEINQDFCVTVKDVRVLPQPMGCFFDSIIHDKKFKYATTQSTLLIDAGYHTFDFMVSNGLEFDQYKHGAYHKSMGAILSSIAESISADPEVGTNYNDLIRIDKSLTLGIPFLLFGKEYDLKRHMSGTKTICDEALAAVCEKVGNGTSIDNILVCGGAAQYFLHAIKDKFSKHDIQTARNTIYSNVRGFQLAGEQIMRQAELSVMY